MTHMYVILSNSMSYTINLVLDQIFTNGTKEFKGLSRKRLRKLFDWVCNKTTFQFDGHFYKQHDGVAMGSPIGPFMADLIMKHVVEQALKSTPLEHKPTAFYRYMDDCFVLSPSVQSLDTLFQHLNNVHTSIKFTKEMEIDHSLPFLDIKVTYTPNGFGTSTYHKPTNSGG